MHGLQGHQTFNPQKGLRFSISRHHGRGVTFAGSAKESNMSTDGTVSVTSELALIIRIVELQF